MDENNQRLLAELQEQNAQLKRQIADLNRSHHLLQAVVEGTTDAVFVKDLRGRYLMANAAVLNFAGKSVDEILGNDDTLFFSAETARQIMERDRRIIESGQTQTDEEVGTAAGQTRTYLSTKGPYRDEQGRIIGLIGISRDITERKRLDQQLAERERRLRTILDSEPECVKTLAADGTLLEMNQAGLEMIGADSLKQVLGQCVYSLVVPEYQAAYQALIEHVFQGLSETLEFEMVGLKGHRRWLETHAAPLRDESGQIVSLLSVTRDITDRKRIEESLSNALEFNRQIIESAEEGVVVYDREQRYVVWNPFMERLSGVPAADVLGRRPEEVFPFLRDTGVIGNLKRALAGETVTTPDMPFTVPQSGRSGWSSAYHTPLRSVTREIIGVISTVRDVTKRRQDEETLRDSQAFLADLVNTVDGIVWEADAATFQFSFVSQQAERILGYPVQRWLTETTFWTDHVHPHDREAAMECCVTATRQGESHQFEYRMLSADGREVWLKDNVTVVLKDGVPVTLRGIMVEITAQKLTETALRESNERFQLVAKATNDAVWDWNLTSDVGWWNDGVYALFGYQRGQMPPETILWKEHLHPEDRDRVLRGIHATIDGDGQSWSDEYRIIRADGSVGVVFDRGFALRDSSGKAIRMIGAAQDITARKRTEEGLRESEGRLRLLMQASNVGLWDWNLITNEVNFSPEWKRQLGYSIEEVSGHFEEWRTRVHPEDLVHALMAVSDFLAGRREDYDVEFRMRHKDGSWRWILARANMVHDSAGQPIRLMGCHVDITDRKQAEIELRQSRSFLEKAQHLANLGTWVCGPAPGDPLWWSEQTYEIFGISPGQFDGRVENFFERVHPDDRLAVQTSSRLAHSGERAYDLEHRILRPDGSVRWVHELADIVRDADGQVMQMIGVVQDITERRRAEEATRASQQRFATVFRSSPAGICVTKLADGTFLDMNDAFLKIIGHAREEMLGRSSLVLNYWLDPEDRAKVVQALQTNGSVRNWEMQFLRRDGSIRDSIRSLERITLGGEDCILTILEDITERKQAEVALASERLLLRTMADNLPGYVFVKDTAGHYLLVNYTHARQLGLSSEAEMLGKTVFDFFPADIAQSFDADDQTVIQTGQPVIEREEPFEVNGQLGWFLTTKVPLRDAEGAITGLVGIALDITARKQAEAALVEERNLLRTLVDHIPDFIFVKDTESRQLLNNAANLRLVGAPTDTEMVGKTVFDIYPRELAQRYYDEDQRVMSSGQAQLNQEESILDQEGQERWLLSSKVPLRDVHGKCIGLVGIKRDITEHRRANIELAASRERLEILSRQLIETQESERRHLARELHDEIGQSLTGIKLNLKALQQPARESISTTLVANTIAVVDQVLQQVRSLALDLRPSMLDDIGLVAALRWCLDRQSRLAGFVATFVADAADGHVSPDVTIACFRVAQEALTNIARHAHALNVRVELHHQEAELNLLVQDDGCGFEVAVARDRSVRGGSLGLLGMEERVQLVGGQIEMTSTPAGGTTIHARFPLHDSSRTTEGSS